MWSAGCSPLSSPLSLPPPLAYVSPAWNRRGTGSCGQGGRECGRKRRRNKHHTGDGGEGRTSNRPRYQPKRKNTNKNNPQRPLPSPADWCALLSHPHCRSTRLHQAYRRLPFFFLPQRINVWFFVNLTTTDDMTRCDYIEQK